MIKYIIQIFLFSIVVISCRKTEDKFLDFEKESNLLRNSSGSYSNYVSYNSTYDVLCFASWQDVEQLEQLIIEKSMDYPFDQGNLNPIMSTFDSLNQYGYQHSSNSNLNAVDLQNFGNLLDQSYPLSDSVLNTIIENHAILPSQFIFSVLTENLPFSYNFEENIKSSNIGQTLKASLIDENDDFLDAPNHAFNDFLNSFPSFNSLYEKLNNETIGKLYAGVDPSADGFDEDIVELPFERLIMNNKHEVYVEGHLYKLYEKCRGVVFSETINNAYIDLNILDQNGGPDIPIISETNSGVPLTVIDNYIPQGYIVYNPQLYDPLGSSEDDPYYNTALQAYNIVEGCPISNYTYSLYSSSDLTIDFYDMTDFGFAAETESSYIQYWDFGDGTGSFLNNPVHEYSAYGTYIIKLTTFNADCGCWHVHQDTISIISPEQREGNINCKIDGIEIVTKSVELEEYQVFIDVEAGTPTNPESFVTNYIFEFQTQSGTPVETIDNGSQWWIYHTFASTGIYKVLVTLLWSDGCVSIGNYHEFVVLKNPSSENCCDKKEKEKPEDKFESHLGNDYKLKIKDISRGTFGAPAWRKIYGTQELYVKKPGKKWKKQPAWHKIFLDYVYWNREIHDGKEVCLNPVSDPLIYANTSGEFFSYENGRVGLPKFGLQNGSVEFRHTVYLGGSMTVLKENIGGHLLFNEIFVTLGECP